MHAGSGHLEWDRSLLEEVDLAIRASAGLTAAPEPASANGLSFLLQCLVPWGAKGTVEARALSAPVRSGLRDKALRWLELITRWPDRSAGLRAELALLVAAVGQSEDTSAILRLIDEDRHDAARVLAESGRRRTNVFTNQYVDALVRIGSESAKLILERLLDDPEYLGDASRGLADFTAAPEGLELWPPRRWAQAAEAHRTAAGRVSRRHPDGQTIEHALTRLVEARRSPRDPPYAHEVSQALRALARLDAPATYRSIEKVLDNPGADWGVLDALEALAVGGDVAPVHIARRTSARFVEEFRRTRDQQAWYAVLRAVSVLFFSSEPAQGVTAVRELQSWIGPTYWMCELVERIGLLGTADANGLVLEWYGDASIQPRCARQLFAALAAHPSSAGDVRLIEALSMPPDSRHERSALVAACRRRAENPAFRQALLARTSSSIPEERSVLAEVISWLRGDDVAEAACWLLDDGRPGVGWSRIEDAFEGREALDSPGTYRPFPKSCARVREQLFQMYVSDGDRSESARRLLIRVEQSRLEMGRPDDEPRHPRWSPTSDAPWPEPIGRQVPGDGSRPSAPRAPGPE
jgi:hypothetical protein